MLNLLLAALLMSPTPWFISAVPAGPGAWTGYEATIEVADAGNILSVHAWPGGYLSDGTFVQNGMTMPNDGGDGMTFAIISDEAAKAADPAYGLRYLSLETLPHGAIGSWWTFGMTWNRTHRDWVFYIIDPQGRRYIQGAYRTSASTLRQFMVVAEPWVNRGAPFPTVAVRNVRVRDAANHWSVPKLRYDSLCEHDGVTSAGKGNLVFAWLATACPPHNGWLW